jgi:NitT/TauT family transport system substrate-binding protein
MGQFLKRPLHGLAVLIALFALAPPALAQEPVRIGIGFGLAFLPLYICEDLKLIEKHAKAAHLEVKATYRRFMDAASVQDAIASGAIDMGPFGAVPLLSAWQKTKDTPNQIFAVSGITSLPPVLLSDQPNVQSLADLKPSDHIAVPTPTSPQMYLLEMQSEKVFGQYDRLYDQIIALPHADAIMALTAGGGSITAYFSSAPYTQLALRTASIHRVLSASDVMNGKMSFLIVGATKAYIEAHAQIPDVVDKAMEEAARIIRGDPRRAAQIYLTHEPSMVLNAPLIEGVLRENKDEFGSAVYGMQNFADFMGRHGELKNPPKSWKEIVAPALLNSPSS